MAKAANGSRKIWLASQPLRFHNDPTSVFPEEIVFDGRLL